MLRLFTGLSLPDSAAQDLRALCRGLPGARWTPAENFHLTLSFVGEVDEALAEDILHALDRLRAPGFALEIAGADTFRTGQIAHTLWAGVEKNAALFHLREKVETALLRAGASLQHRKFLPHVTLARLKGVDEARLAAWLFENARLRLPAFDVAAFHLYISHQTKAGPRYEIAQSFPLLYAGDDGESRKSDESDARL